jgi:hypothetical protein
MTDRGTGLARDVQLITELESMKVYQMVFSNVPNTASSTSMPNPRSVNVLVVLAEIP